MVKPSISKQLGVERIQTLMTTRNQTTYIPILVKEF